MQRINIIKLNYIYKKYKQKSIRSASEAKMKAKTKNANLLFIG